MRAMPQTPKSNYNDNSTPGAAAHAGHPQSHSVRLMNIKSLTFSSSQESVRGDDLIRKGKKRKTTTQTIQVSPNGQHEIENTLLTELSSYDYTCQYEKDRLNGKITCMVCGEEGHYTCDCSMMYQEKKVICTLCNRVGHCHLWCCRQNISENRACHRCGEKGHYIKKKKLVCSCQKCGHIKDISCSSCDTNHLPGNCPMGDITCFICEGKDHVPAQCRFSPMLTAVTQYHREIFHATLKKAMTETSRRTLAPVKPSGEFSHGEEIHVVSDLSSSGHGHSERKNAIRSELSDSDKTSHATMTNKALALVSKSTCPNCHDEGHCADNCPRKKPSGESDLHDATYGKKKPRELKLCDITCFICEDKGHKSYSCPKKKPPGALELSDATCLKCNAKDHYTYTCPKKKPPGKMEQYDDSHEFQFKGGSEMLPSRLGHGEEDHCHRKSPIRSQAPYSDKGNHAAMRDKQVTLVSKLTCFNCHEGHRAKKCPGKKPPQELELHDATVQRNVLEVTLVSKLTCFNCHEEGHHAKKCPGKKPPEELELHGATPIDLHANSCPKKTPGELELSDVTCFKCHDKGHKSYSCPKKSPGQLETSDVTCFKCHGKGHKSYSCPNKSLEELELSDVTCFNCHDKGHKSNSCSKKKSRGASKLSDATCFRCHEKGHYMNSCPKS